MDWTEFIPSIVLACIAAIPGIAALFKGRGKEKADVAAIYTEIAKDLLEEYRAKLTEVEASYRAKLEEIEATVEEQAGLIRCQERKIEKQAAKMEQQQIEIDQLKEEQEKAQEVVASLCAQIRGLGHEPVWEPEK